MLLDQGALLLVPEITIEVTQLTSIVEVTEPDGGTAIVEVGGEPDVVEVIQSGPIGPPGPIGPQGEPGPSGDDYVVEITSPSDEWVITHNLGRYPSGIQVIDSTKQLVGTEIVHDSLNQFRSLADGAMTGWITYT